LASIPVLRESVLVDDLTWQTVGICERAAAILLLLVLAPALLVCAVTTWLLSGRAPLIAHKRVGWRGSALWMLKLRTMWDGAPAARAGGIVERIDDEDGPGRKNPADSRVPCAFARFCRRHSIDEIPQLWHVIRGEMSLVGPRPVTAREIREYYGAEADEMLQVKPGIAGLWQTSGRNRLTYRERRAMDLEFVRRRSLRMYLRILLRTLPEVWSGANAC
jgi:lipopolysaccharide/colanic/teichoic acid biosynthesis glycosyltransferase